MNKMEKHTLGTIP